jgi:DNA invertase Pin-like site-specific DNA recombinase
LKPIKVAIYARVSTADQDPDAQLFALREYAVRRSFIIYREYVDYVTGIVEKRNAKSKDKAFQKLMADVRKRQVDCVLVWKYDRFARSLNTLIAALEEFASLGVDFISYTQHIDTTTPMGRLFFHVIGSFAEFERELIVERVRAGIAKARAKGVSLGRPERDKSAGDRILFLRASGMSLRQIAKREQFSPAGVLKIIKRWNNREKIAEDHAL